MGRSIVTYKDFSGGESGRLTANTSAKAPRNGFTAYNMLVSQDGMLYVRPGLKTISPSGLSNGVVHGFGNTPVPSSDLWFVQGTAVRTFGSDGSNLRTSGTALAETPAQPLDWKTDGSTILVASAADKLYRISPHTASNPDVAGLTGSPGAACLEVYGDRIVAGNIDGSNGYRLRYSAVADPNDWPAGNFIDIGDAFGLTGLYTQRQHLLLTKQNQMHVLTGTLGSNEVLRRVYSGDGPLHPLQARMGPRDLLWYHHIFATYPASFNGTYPNELSSLVYGSSTPNTGGVALIPPSHGVSPFSANGGGAVFVSDSRAEALVYWNGVWTSHSFDVDVSGYVASNGQFIYFCDGGGASATPNFYSWDVTSGEVGATVTSDAGDASSSTPVQGGVTFPEWWTEDGTEVVVRSIIVDFVEFSNGTAENKFDMKVTALKRYQGDAGADSTTLSYTVVPTLADKTRRRIFGVGEQGMGGGFRLDLYNIQGIGIVSIQVVLDTQPLRD